MLEHHTNYLITNKKNSAFRLMILQLKIGVSTKSHSLIDINHRSFVNASIPNSKSKVLSTFTKCIEDFRNLYIAKKYIYLKYYVHNN